MTRADSRDPGIFATASPAEFKAMANYAGDYSLCRQAVTVSVRDLGSYQFDDFPQTIDDAKEWFEAARRDTPEEYRAGLRVKLEYESGSYDCGDTASLTITYARPETDDEMRARFDDYMAYVRNGASAERAQYERLRRKFEGKP